MGSPGDLGTAAALPMEPVLSSLAGGCLSLVVALKTAKKPDHQDCHKSNPEQSPADRKQMSHIDTQAREGVHSAFGGPRHGNGRTWALALIE